MQVLKGIVMPDNNQDQPVINKSTPENKISKIGVCVIIVALISIIFLTTLNSCEHVYNTPERWIKGLISKFSNPKEEFLSGKVTNEYIEYWTGIKQMNRLQFSQIKTVETFRLKETKGFFGNNFFATAEVVVKTPVEYNFYVDLNGKWDFIYNENDNSVIVVAPRISYNKPSVDVSLMEIRNINKSIWINNEELKNKILKNVMPHCAISARKKVIQIKPLAKDSIKNFVDAWFINIKFADSKIKPHVKEIYVFLMFLSSGFFLKIFVKSIPKYPRHMMSKAVAPASSRLPTKGMLSGINSIKPAPILNKYIAEITPIQKTINPLMIIAPCVLMIFCQEGISLLSHLQNKFLLHGV